MTGIKTNELQQLSSVLGTDSVLLDSASAGTGRLRLDALARYMDGELMKSGTALSSALSNKANLSAQQTVEAQTIPSRTVEVAAEELYAYLSSLPRLLTENLTITARGGTAPEYIKVSGLYGPGSLTIQAKAGEDVVCPNQFMAIACAVPIYANGLKFNGKTQSGGIFASYASRIFATDCLIDILKVEASGCITSQNGFLALERCTIQNCGYALNSQQGGIIVAVNCAGSGNSVGLMVSRGGIILLSGTTPDLMGGSSNVKGGGIIAKANGTLL